MEFLLNVFSEFSEFSDKKYLSLKGVPTCQILCKRPSCYHGTSKTHVSDRIFKLTPIHALVIYKIP